MAYILASLLLLIIMCNKHAKVRWSVVQLQVKPFKTTYMYKQQQQQQQHSTQVY